MQTTTFLLWYERQVEPDGWYNPIQRVETPQVPEQILDSVPLVLLTALDGIPLAFELVPANADERVAALERLLAKTMRGLCTRINAKLTSHALKAIHPPPPTLLRYTRASVSPVRECPPGQGGFLRNRSC